MNNALNLAFYFVKIYTNVSYRNTNTILLSKQTYLMTPNDKCNTNALVKQNICYPLRIRGCL